MRILLFIDSLGSGGAQRQLVGLAKMLKERSYEVEIAVYHDIPFFEKELNKINIPVRLFKGKYAKRIAGFYKIAKKYNPDWVIAFLETPCIIACIVKVFLRYNLIVSERNTSQILNLKTKIRFNLYRIANHVVPNAYSQEKFIVDHAKFLKTKTSTINNFVDTDYFKPSNLNFMQDKIQEIVVAATIWPSKNTLKFIDAVELLSKKYNHFHISWYGKNDTYSDYIKKCEAKIEEKRIEKYISLLDKTKNIREKYQKAKWFCLPSLYEGTPNVIGEAMACGIPIVCSNVCDNSIYVKSEENGLLFNPNSPEDMSDKLYLALTQTNETYNNMCNVSRNRAIQLLSPRNFIEKYINLINKSSNE